MFLAGIVRRLCLTLMPTPQMSVFQQPDRASSAAFKTTSGSSSSRHLLFFVPLHPSLPHGAQSQGICMTVLRRTFASRSFADTETGYRSQALSLSAHHAPIAVLSHGPQSNAPEGPKTATTGVPTAAAICIGAESTPKKARRFSTARPSALT